MKEDLAHKFWKEYVEADTLKRIKIVEKIVKFGIWQEVLRMNKIKKKIGNLTIQEHCLATNLMSYFDDLIDYMGK